MIDDFKIYDYARTPAQIAYDYNGGKPIAHWKFDECSGGTIHDESGNGNHGTLQLGTAGVTATGTCASSSDSFWYNGRNGKYNSGGSFDGDSDYIDVTSSLGLYDDSDMTVSMWLKFNQTFDSGASLHQIIFSQSDASSENDFTLLFDASSGKLNMQTFDSDIRNLYTIKNSWTGGIWYHITAVLDEDNMKTIYVNGVSEVNTAPITNRGTTLASECYIGKSYQGYYFDGQIDEVKIWNYSLTAEQVMNEYNGGAVRFGN